MDTEKLISAYIKLRDARAENKQAFDEADAEFERKLNMIESKLLELSKELGLDSMKTASGTAFKVVKTRYWAPDWESFYDWIDDHTDDPYALLEKRIHQSNFKQFMEENPDVAPPVNADSRYSITVRRSNKL